MTERDEIRIDKALQGAAFPTSKEDLLQYARERVHDSPKTLHALDALPDREYANKDEVIAAVPQQPEGEDTPGGRFR
ncbi:DUF2795 domain-containing protein [Corynebacterium halotolerans]|uniref:DUF2795 domain-containing protein n=1 Tax=Corynebacterium halotolerans TaxID=225326 RepID=UPI003CF25A8C